MCVSVCECVCVYMCVFVCGVECVGARARVHLCACTNTMYEYLCVRVR